MVCVAPLRTRNRHNQTFHHLHQSKVSLPSRASAQIHGGISIELEYILIPQAVNIPSAISFAFAS